MAPVTTAISRNIPDGLSRRKWDEIDRGTQQLLSWTQRHRTLLVPPVTSALGRLWSDPQAVLWLHAVCALDAAYSLTVVRHRETEAIKTWLIFFFIKLKTSPDPKCQIDGVRSVFSQRSGGRREVQRSVERGNDALCFPIILSARLDAHCTQPPPPPPSSSCTRRTPSHCRPDGVQPSAVLCSVLSSNLRWAVSQTASQEKKHWCEKIKVDSSALQQPNAATL